MKDAEPIPQPPTDMPEVAKIDSLDSMGLLWSFMHDIPGVASIKDLEGRILEVSPNYLDVVGMRECEILGKTVHDIFPKAAADAAMSHHKRVLSEGKASTLEETLVHADGEPHDYLTTMFPFRNADSVTIASASIAIDITEKKRMEERIRLIGEITEQISDAVIAASLDFNITYTNRAFRDLYGYSSEEVAGRSPDFLNAEPLASEIQENIYETVASGSSWRGEVINRRKDGSTFPCELTVSPLCDDNGDLFAYAGTQRDIADRKRVEESLKQATAELELRVAERTNELEGTNQRLRLEVAEREKAERDLKLFKYVADTANYSMAITDLTGKFLYVNQHAAEIHGYSVDELQGEGIDIFHSEEQLDAVRHVIAEVLQTGNFGPVEVWHTHKNGAMFPMLMSGVSMHGGPQEAACMAATAVDLTELKCAEELVRRTENLTSLGTFAAGMAHEINNPLAGLLAATDTAIAAVHDVENCGAIHGALNDIRSEALRCGSIVKAVLNFARSEVKEKVPHDMNAVIRSAIDMTRSHASEHSAEVEFVTCDDQLTIALNRLEMEHAVANLVKNAVESAEGVRVVITASRSQQGVVVCIEDDGVGMTQSSINRAFDPFFTTRRALGGTGLGLTLAHSFIANHGGTMSVESVPGVGTKLKVELPGNVTMTLGD